MMKHLGCLSSLVAISFLLLCEPIVVAQQDATHSPTVRTIYLENIHHKGKTRFDKDVEIDNFAQKLVELRLAELKFYELKIEDAPKCKEKIDEDSVSKPPNQGQDLVSDEADYYVIRAFIEIRSPENREPEIVLDYELVKYVQCQSVSLIRNPPQPFAESEVLKYLNSMAEVFSAILEREQKAKKVSVEVVPFTSSDPELQQVTTNLTNEVISQLTRASEFEPREARKGETSPTSDFTLGGQLLSGEKLELRLTIRSKAGQPAQHKITDEKYKKGMNEGNLIAFYKDFSDSVMAYLQQVRRDTEKLRLSLSTEAAALAQLDMAKTLCGNESAQKGCKQPEEVAAKLLQVVESRRLNNRREKLLETYRLLGIAQTQVGDNLQAAASFDAALRNLPKNSSTTERVDLLNQAGEAWFQAKDYQEASKRFDESLQLIPLQAEIHLKLAKSYRYGNERLTALKKLLVGLQTLPQAQKELGAELEYLINDLREEEVELARQFLEGQEETLPVKFAKSLLRSKPQQNR